jgi:hypothetical protein
MLKNNIRIIDKRQVTYRKSIRSLQLREVRSDQELGTDAILASMDCANTIVLSVLASLLATATCVADESMNSDRVRHMLRDMQSTSTWYHDDLFGEFSGFQFYAQHRYAQAMHYFELGAYYADKPSQISLGLMYLKGEGVRKNAPQALAWMELAAERGYPAYAATRDRVAASMTAEQRARAEELVKTLTAKYGDAVAKPRLANELRAGRRQMTGSRAGFDTGVKFLPLGALDPSHPEAAGSVSARTVCPRGFWDAECWDPERYFAMRDRQLQATVEVGPPQQQK